MVRSSTMLCVALFAGSPSAYAQEPAGSTEHFRTGALAALVTKYCGGCHAGEKAKGQLRLEPLPAAREAGVWVKVRQHLAAGTMPPEDRPQPAAEERRAIVAGLKTLLADCGGERDAAAVKTVLRRLNRTQYRNTIRDLFGIDFDPTGLMPADEVGSGFDNIGAAQRMSPALLRHYLRMAREVAAQVIVTDPTEVAPVVAELEWRTEGSKKPMKIPAKYFGPRLVQPLAFPVEVPAEDDYLLQVQLIPENWREQPQSLQIEVEGREIGRIASDDQDLTWHRHQVHLGAGKHTLTLRMVPNPNQPRGGPEQVIRVEHLKLTRPNAVTAAHYPAAHRRVVRAVPGEGRSAREAARLVLEPLAREAARLVLEPLARQAFRRPVNAAQVDGLLRVFEAAQTDGASYEAALRHALEALLCSPRFLFLAEADAGQALDDYALASRLSYFL